MTATKNLEGQIVLPREVAAAADAEDVEEFNIMISTSGVIRLNPVREHQKSLVEHLSGMRGLVIERRRDPIPQAPEL